VHRSVTGVTVLEHLERLDAVEASLTRLGTGEDTVIEEEVDVGHGECLLHADAIEIYVSRLRKKLEPCDAAIFTLRGLGYLLKPRHA